MLTDKVIIALFLIFEVNSADQNVLFHSGWYRSHRSRKRSDRNQLFSVESINPTTVPSSVFLKINAVIPVLYEGSIRDLDELEDLVISACGIRDVQAGAFRNLPSLSRLNLKENGIEHIKTGVFNFLPITNLFLNKNEIKTIDSNAFNDMPQLRKIKLNSNHISAWDSGWFKNCPLLGVVLVRRNNIKNIPARAFQNLARKENSSDTDKLPDPKIFLSRNEISSIDPEAFVGLGKVGQLWLDRNHLQQLNGSSFRGLSQIHLFNVARNNITGVPQDLFQGVRNVRLFDISANPKIKCVPVNLIEVVKELKIFNGNLNCTCLVELQKSARTLKHRIEGDC